MLTILIKVANRTVFFAELRERQLPCYWHTVSARFFFLKTLYQLRLLCRVMYFDYYE